VKGSHKEIGEQIGNLYRKWGKKKVKIPPFAGTYYRQQLDIYKRYFPLYLEYLKGISTGLGIPEATVLKSYLTGFLDFSHNQTAHKCSVFGLKNNGGIIVGRNYDWLEASEKVSMLITVEFTDGSAHNFTGVTDMGTWEVGKRASSDRFMIVFDDGWNDQGLYIALNGAPGTNKPDVRMCTPHVVQAVLEQCKTTEDAVELLKKIPVNKSKIFMLADKKGHFAVVEKSSVRGTFVRESRDVIFSTNHFNHRKLLAENLSIFRSIPFHSTFARYHYLQYALEKDKAIMNIDRTVKLLSKPPILQNWRGVENGDSMSIWTYGLNLTTHKYKIIFAPLLEEKKIVEN
jgi:predicted choloylglycine hydrolase